MNLSPQQIAERIEYLEKIEARYKLLTQKTVRQGTELSDRGGFKIDKSPTQCLMRFDYWCTLEKMEEALDLEVKREFTNLKD